MPTHAIGTRLISLTQIHPNPEQIRREFDPAGLEELKNSIRERGLISPIAVWQRGESDFVIIAGERRFRGVSSLGWKEVDCRIWPAGTPPEEVELLSLVENIQRRDLNPIEVAGGYRVLSRPPYAWVYGKNGLMARKAKPLSWADLGEKDPVAGCHALIEAQEMMLEDRDKP